MFLPYTSEYIFNQNKLKKVFLDKTPIAYQIFWLLKVLSNN